MKNNKLVRKLALLALCATLGACSAEITSEGPGGIDNPNNSLKVQNLKVTSNSQIEAEENELYLSRPSETVTYFFDYRPTEDERLYWESGTQIGINCSTQNVARELRWLEIHDGNVVGDSLWSAGESFIVRGNREYKLSLTLKGLTSCDNLGLTFVVRSYPVQ